MAYRSTSKTRQQKEAKRARMMQAAIHVFADKGYHSATIRDIVQAAEVSIGTFYFYFPDKEALFAHLYEETADFLLQAIQQAIHGRTGLPKQLQAGLQAYVNIAIYEPAVVRLLLVGGAGAVPSLDTQRVNYRERLITIWQGPLEESIASGDLPSQNARRLAEALTGAFDEVILNLLDRPNPEGEALILVEEMVGFALRAVAYPVQ